MFFIPGSLYSAGAIRAIAGTFLALCTLFVAGRFYARFDLKARLQADDWLMVPAYLSFIVIAACLLESTYDGSLGYTPSEFKAMGFKMDRYSGAVILILIDVFFGVCMGMVKLSALCFYKRVFCTPYKNSHFRAIVNAMIVAVSLWTVTFFAFPLALCGDHFDGNWEPKEFSLYCAKNGQNYQLASSATDTFLELIVIFLPIHKIWNLQTTTRKRMAITLVFLTALLSLAAALIRLGNIARMFETKSGITEALGAEANSATYNMWLLECGVAIVAVNMPSLWYLRGRKAPEKILRSLRSMVSLRSTQSKYSSTSAVGARADDPASVELGKMAKRSISESTDAPSAIDAGTDDPKIHAHISSDGMAAYSATPSRVSNERYALSRYNDIKVTHNVTQSVEKI